MWNHLSRPASCLHLPYLWLTKLVVIIIPPLLINKVICDKSLTKLSQNIMSNSSVCDSIYTKWQKWRDQGWWYIWRRYNTHLSILLVSRDYFLLRYFTLEASVNYLLLTLSNLSTRISPTQTWHRILLSPFWIMPFVPWYSPWQMLWNCPKHQSP